MRSCTVYQFFMRFRVVFSNKMNGLIRTDAGVEHRREWLKSQEWTTKARDETINGPHYGRFVFNGFAEMEPEIVAVGEKNRSPGWVTCEHMSVTLPRSCSDPSSQMWRRLCDLHIRLSVCLCVTSPLTFLHSQRDGRVLIDSSSAVVYLNRFRSSWVSPGVAVEDSQVLFISNSHFRCYNYEMYYSKYIHCDFFSS